MRAALFLGFIVTFSHGSFGQVQYPEHYQTVIDVIYTEVGNWKGRMDIYTNPSSKEPTPIVINIHGGGWNHGTKESQTGFGPFFRKGYAIANLEYRLVDVSPAPAAIEDVRCALIYLFNHATDLNIDPNKIVIMGSSSGGHLALMAGLLGNDGKFDAQCPPEETIGVAAIIDKYGPTDLTALTQHSSVKRWLGVGYQDILFIESVSPLFFINEKSPPVFIVHGTSDSVVPYEQSALLFEKLQRYGIKSKFISLEGEGHGKFTRDNQAKVNEEMWCFLDEIVGF